MRQQKPTKIHTLRARVPLAEATCGCERPGGWLAARRACSSRKMSQQTRRRVRGPRRRVRDGRMRPPPCRARAPTRRRSTRGKRKEICLKARRKTRSRAGWRRGGAGGSGDTPGQRASKCAPARSETAAGAGQRHPRATGNAVAAGTAAGGERGARARKSPRTTKRRAPIGGPGRPPRRQRRHQRALGRTPSLQDGPGGASRCGEARWRPEARRGGAAAPGGERPGRETSGTSKRSTPEEGGGCGGHARSSHTHRSIQSASERRRSPAVPQPHETIIPSVRATGGR